MTWWICVSLAAALMTVTLGAVRTMALLYLVMIAAAAGLALWATSLLLTTVLGG